MPSREDWFNFFKPFDTQEAAFEWAKTSNSMLISTLEYFGTPFKFRLTGVWND